MIEVVSRFCLLTSDVLKATCVDEELEECELLDIAEHLKPDALLRLAIKLSLSAAEYLRMKESHRSELAFMILYRWRENLPEGPQNRKELVGVLFDLNKVRLAEMVASKIYTGFSWPHQLSQSRWEMGTATINTTSDSDSAVKGTSTSQTAGVSMIDYRASSIAYTDSYTWI